YRYLIPQYVPADKALYLDSDLIVTNDISHLFKLDIDDYYIAAVENRTFKKGFNAGVMLINLKKWRAENITVELIQLTYKKHDEVATADQSIMNMRFGANWYRLNPTYNFQIGADKNLI
ncbi:glycosyltransferase, partial [Streptococcus suis]